MHAHQDFDSMQKQEGWVHLDKDQNLSKSALLCHNSQAQNKYEVINLIYTRQTFLSFYM